MDKPSLIRDMAVIERLRDRLAKLGVSGLKAEEFLALVIRTGYRGHGALDVARQILAQYPLPELLALSFSKLSKLRGVGEGHRLGWSCPPFPAAAGVDAVPNHRRHGEFHARSQTPHPSRQPMR